MKFKLLGTRGSRPVFSPDRVKYGGNTTAYKIEIEGMAPIYIDGGSGLYKEGVEIDKTGQPLKASFLITHTHWDHILAFPFFKPLYREGTKIIIMGPSYKGYNLAKLFESQHAKDLFPVPFSMIADRIEFRELSPGMEFDIEKAKIRTIQLNHQGLTLGYRIESDGKSLCIITDQAPIENNHLGYSINKWSDEEAKAKEEQFYSELVQFVKDTDFMLHDTHFDLAGIKGKEDWGHATAEMAVDLAAKGGAKRLMLAHHAPEDTDTMVEKKIRDAKEHARSIDVGKKLEILALSEGDEICL